MKTLNKCIKCLKKTTNLRYCIECWNKSGLQKWKSGHLFPSKKASKAFTKKVKTFKQCKSCLRPVKGKYKICFSCWQAIRLSK